MPGKRAREATANQPICLVMPGEPQSQRGKQGMQAEFLPDGAPDCPILRLFGFQAAEIARLQALCLNLANGSARQAEVPAELVNGCRLTLSVGHMSQGVVRSDQHGLFECILTSERWEEAATMLAPFCRSKDKSCFQWLDETSEISLLVSQSGQW